MPFDRATQERRAKRAEKDLSLLGKVNPLALEEFAALEERYRFLSTQLTDLTKTREDLLSVVADVDAKILEVFTSAYADVAREFEVVFATLFPGGQGRLVLTEPGDLLATGVDVEARPPGKKIKRLSLLSGGEKSLVAVAMLVAIYAGWLLSRLPQLARVRTRVPLLVAGSRVRSGVDLGTRGTFADVGQTLAQVASITGLKSSSSLPAVRRSRTAVAAS